MALERLEKALDLPSKLVKRCYSIARLPKALERLEKDLERLDLPSKLTKRCHNQANKGLRKARNVKMYWKVFKTLSQPGNKGLRKMGKLSVCLSRKERKAERPNNPSEASSRQGKAG